MAEPADQAAEDGRPAAPLMTLTEASAATGRPAEAIRAMVRRGRLKALKGNDGRTLVEIPADLLRPTGQPSAGRDHGHDGRPADRGAAEDGRVAALELAVEEWRAAAEEARLEAAVAVAEARLLKQELERDRADLVRERERADRLEAALAEARRPVLVRLLESMRRRS